MGTCILSVFIALVAVIAITNPVFCKGDDKTDDESSGTTTYQSLTSQRTSGGYRVEVDLSGQVLSLDIPTRTYSALEAGESRLYPAPGASQSVAFVSASILAAKAKQFDDGLYATTEVAVQEGLPDVMGKEKFLAALSDALKNPGNPSITQSAKESARAFILAASSLGGHDLSEDAKVAELSQKIKEKFLGEALLSKPIGFYTWNSQLGKIFQQDRLLQSELKDPALFASAIREKAGQTKDFYFKYLGLVEKMTNPLPSDFSDLRPLIEKPSMAGAGKDKKTIALFPPSRSYETDLVKKLYGQKPIPANFNLAEKLIAEIKAENINLTPRQDSGWYDYQTYSLESLILPDKFPEGKKVQFSQSYRKELEELFKSLLALTRETHVKQLEIPKAGARRGMTDEAPQIRIDISPDLSLEPLATYYLRRARSYNFIHGVLKEALGEQNLSKMHRLTASGPVKEDLHSELKQMEALFFGAALIVADETGCVLEVTARDGSGNGTKEDIRFARHWMNHLSDDPDVSMDNRMMVPVFYDVQRKLTKVWVVLGYEMTTFQAGFRSRPQVKVFDSGGKRIDDSKLDVHYNSQTSSLWYPVFAEIYVKKILDRNEFRELCDKYSTKSEILKALQTN